MLFSSPLETARALGPAELRVLRFSAHHPCLPRAPRTANWAEAKFESYYVTDCKQLPPNMISFTDIKLLTDGSTDYSRSVPWSAGYVTTDPAFRTVNCSGYASAQNEQIEISFEDCR